MSLVAAEPSGELAPFLAEVRTLVDDDLARRLAPSTAAPDADAATRLLEAMRYAVLGGGKRVRPAIAIAACEATGGERAAALAPACAIELLHAYTLIHDDLPAMDDDSVRRGRPTVHVAFGEAIAILAGDGLCTAAFAALAELGPAAADAVAVLGRRAGAAELLAGQALDLAAAGATPTFAALERIHRGKTAALFAAAAELGAIAAGAAGAARARAADYGLAIGLAFQHADDLDDREHAAHAAAARERWSALTDEALALAAGFGPGGARLGAIARWVGARP
jgi:geranylgeranyl pyrophosphate synthase